MDILKHLELIFRCIGVYFIFGLGLLGINLIMYRMYFGNRTEQSIVKSIPGNTSPSWVSLIAFGFRRKKLQS